MQCDHAYQKKEFQPFIKIKSFPNYFNTKKGIFSSLGLELL